MTDTIDTCAGTAQDASAAHDAVTVQETALGANVPASASPRCSYLLAVARPAVLEPRDGDVLPGAEDASRSFDAPDPSSASVSTSAPVSAPAAPVDPVAPARRRGLAAWLARFFGGARDVSEPLAPAEAPACAPAVRATAASEPAAPLSPAYVERLERLAGQPADVAYAIVAQGFPVPPGGAAYLVELPADPAQPADSELPADPARPAVSPAPAAQPASGAGSPTAFVAPASVVFSSDAAVPEDATIVAYLDAYGRAFSAGSVQTMPPARMPDVQLMRYKKPGGATGCIDVATGKAKSSRLAEYVQAADGTYSIVGSRVDFGFEPAGLSLVQATALAFLALWLLPRHDGVPLSSISVKDVLGHLRAPNLFETLDLFMADARQAEAHPLLTPPGLVSYTASCLRAAALEHLRPTDLVSRADAEALRAFAPAGPFLGGAPVVMEGMLAPGADLPAGVTTIEASVPAGGDLLASIQEALAASGIAGLAFAGGTGPHGEKIPAVPSVRLVRTSAYANLFYVLFDRGQVSADGARKLLEAESILNRFVLMAEALDQVGAVQSATFEQVAALDAWLVDRIGGLAFPYVDNAVEVIERADTGSAELDVRFSFAKGCERLRLPFRLEYGYRFDAAQGDLVIDVEVPSSVLMPSPWRERTYAEREGLASRYALHLAAVLGAVAFWAGEGVRRATVNCWHGLGVARGVDELAPLGGGLVRGPVMDEPVCVATVQFDRASFAESLATPGQRAAFEDDPFAFVAGARHGFTLDADGHLGRVQPLYALDDERLHPHDANLQPEFDDRPLTDRGAELLRAGRVSELAIYEDAARKRAAEQVADAFVQGGKDAALAAVKDAHDRTENLLVREACLRVQEGISSDAIGASTPRREIIEALTDIYGLQGGMRRAYRTLQTDPRAARGRLESMLAELDERVIFADTATRRYRYFDAYASRVLYGARCREANDGRELRLCADEYYLCHYRLASLLADSLDNAEEAIDHARRCVELAPSVAASYLRLARCYFCVFDYLSEIDTLKAMLAIAWNPTDVGLALYWLGYAFCLVDKPEVGMACYQRCTHYDASLTEPAVTEATEFLRKQGAAPQTYSDRRIDELLSHEGIDLGQVDRNVEFLMQASGAVVDAGAYGLARNLLGSAMSSLRDDALPPLLESLEE